MKFKLGFLNEKDPIQRKINRTLLLGSFVGCSAASIFYGDFLSAIVFLILVVILRIEEKRIESKERLGKNDRPNR